MTSRGRLGQARAVWYAGAVRQKRSNDEETQPQPESLKKLADFARRVIAVPKTEVDKKLREQRRLRKKRR